MTEAPITLGMAAPVSSGFAPLPNVVLEGVWIGSLGNELPSEAVFIYAATLIVLVVLAIVLATLIRCEMRKEGGEREEGKGASSPPS